MVAIKNEVKDNPKIVKKVLKNGKISLFLEYYLGRNEIPMTDESGNPVYYTSGKMAGKQVYCVKHSRQKVSLNLYLIANPRTPEERQQNKETLALAKSIRYEREQEFKNSTLGYRLKSSRANMNFLDYFQSYIDNYTKKDVRMMDIALQRFKDFLASSDRYKMFASSIKPSQITRDMMISFTEYLQTRSKGEGAKSIYQRFKKVINYAVEHDVMQSNPCKGITIKVDDGQLKKDVLSQDEIVRLINTHYQFENPNIERAFLLSCFCGLRFCDVKDLKYSNVDYSNKILIFEQNKTRGHSSSSGVVIPLNDDLIQLIGQPADGQSKNELIFNLPSYEACSKAVKRWVARAGIDKHISWHCARHSFATNILINGANIKTTASLLGHSGLKYVDRYVRAADNLKRAAIDSLPTINLKTME
jgi:Site-specific recombinase XerD